MDANTVAPPQRGMPFRALGPFFALAFGLGWGVAALALLFTAQVEALFGPVSGTNPVFVLVVYSPGIVAVALVWWYGGLAGLGRYFRRLTLWRLPGGRTLPCGNRGGRRHAAGAARACPAPG
jgi:uncharacterized protein